MNKFLLTLSVSLVMFTTTFALSSAQAAEVKVTWSNIEKYRDIYAGTESKKRFRKKVFKSIEKHLLKLAQSLPESQLLEIEVTDVDLAGDVHASGIQQIRVIKDLYFPRIKFSFKLLDAKQAIILSENIDLKDMNFMMSRSLKYRNNVLGYEKQLLDDWFNETFQAHIEK